MATQAARTAAGKAGATGRAGGAPETSRLTRDDWLDAAHAAVVEGGFDQVRVLVLARRLGVTRGSFYWHFADHAALIDALLARWHAREQASNARVAAVAAVDPVRDLELALEAALAHVGPDLENMRFELALRGLGRRNPAVARMLLDVDQQRLDLFRAKFERLCGDPRRAADLAALFYLAVIGSNQALSRPANPPQTKDYLRGVITRYLIQAQAAGAAQVDSPRPPGRRDGPADDRP